jgi:succinate-acetate transporter protein
MDYTKIETGPLSFADWTVRISEGKGTVTDNTGAHVAVFNVNGNGEIILEHGQPKYADMALVALRTFIRETPANEEIKPVRVSSIETVIKDTTANPAPLGLMGFGLTTILLNLHNIGLFGLGSMIVAMGLFYGGAAQILAGLMEWKKKNTFGTVAFTSYGLFWITLVGMIVFPKFGFTEAPDTKAMVAYLFFWGFFTLILFMGTFKMNKIMIGVFATLTVLFFLLAVADMLNNPAIKTLAGYEGIVCGLLAVYAGAAQILNEIYGKDVLPLGNMD